MGAAISWAGAVSGEGPRAALTVLLLAALIAAAVLELRGRRLLLPQLDRETDQSWLHLGAISWAVLNGLTLGTGFLSRIGFLAWYLLPIICFSIGQPEVGALVLGAYGLTRGGAVFGWFAYMNACNVGQGEIFEKLSDQKARGQWLSDWIVVSLGFVALLIVGL